MGGWRSQLTEEVHSGAKQLCENQGGEAFDWHCAEAAKKLPKGISKPGDTWTMATLTAEVEKRKAEQALAASTEALQAASALPPGRAAAASGVAVAPLLAMDGESSEEEEGADAPRLPEQRSTAMRLCRVKPEPKDRKPKKAKTAASAESVPRKSNGPLGLLNVKTQPKKESPSSQNKKRPLSAPSVAGSASSRAKTSTSSTHPASSVAAAIAQVEKWRPQVDLTQMLAGDPMRQPVYQATRAMNTLAAEDPHCSEYVQIVTHLDLAEKATRLCSPENLFLEQRKEYIEAMVENEVVFPSCCLAWL